MVSAGIVVKFDNSVKKLKKGVLVFMKHPKGLKKYHNISL
jgi:hypothetical protein